MKEKRKFRRRKLSGDGLHYVVVIFLCVPFVGGAREDTADNVVVLFSYLRTGNDVTKKAHISFCTPFSI